MTMRRESPFLRLSISYHTHIVEGREILSGAQQWTKISKRIQQESVAWKNSAIAKDKEAHPTTSEVMEAWGQICSR